MDFGDYEVVPPSLFVHGKIGEDVFMAVADRQDGNIKATESMLLGWPGMIKNLAIDTLFM